MKIWGNGQMVFPGTSRVVHDFVDGPLDTTNQILIDEAKKLGFSFVDPMKESASNIILDELKQNKRGRKPNVN